MRDTSNLSQLGWRKPCVTPESPASTIPLPSLVGDGAGSGYFTVNETYPARQFLALDRDGRRRVRLLLV